ncbi:hypothetical protein HGB07_00800, partial [Candidatus Roizmanbacteria bacterium]|nr:hypothetical protein [Candidatus Roizmanbacteria bacterium]
VMGPNTNPLSLLGERQGNKGKFYENIGDHANTPFEMGYIHYPPNPDNPQANATLPSDVMHCHYTCDEMYIVLGGRITLCIDMQYENGNMGPLTGKTIDLDVGNASPDSIKELANIEGVIIYQKTDGSYFFSYTTKPGSYHIITYAVPGTQLLLIKKANRNWSGDGKWSDKIVLE